MSAGSCINTNIMHWRPFVTRYMVSQAMGLMLPGRGAGGGEGLSTKMACMSISSYMPSVANTLQLDTVLDQLKVFPLIALNCFCQTAFELDTCIPCASLK